MNMNTVLKVEKREAGHRSTLTQLRKGGLVPGVLYGYNCKATTPIQLSASDFQRYVQKNGQNGVIEVEFEGSKVNAMIQELQRDALKGQIVHLDFLAVNMKEELETEVPVTLIGTAAGEREGGIVMQPTREITIKVKPSDIPEVIEVDVSALEIGDTLDIAAVRDKFDFEIISEDELTLATVTAPTVEAASDDEETGTEEQKTEE